MFISENENHLNVHSYYIINFHRITLCPIHNRTPFYISLCDEVAWANSNVHDCEYSPLIYFQSLGEMHRRVKEIITTRKVTTTLLRHSSLERKYHSSSFASTRNKWSGSSRSIYHQIRFNIAWGC